MNCHQCNKKLDASEMDNKAILWKTDGFDVSNFINAGTIYYCHAHMAHMTKQWRQDANDNLERLKEVQQEAWRQ